MIRATKELPDWFTCCLTYDVPQCDVTGRDRVDHKAGVVAAVSGEIVESVAQFDAVKRILAYEGGRDEFTHELAYDMRHKGALRLSPTNKTIVRCDTNQECFGEQIVGGSVMCVTDIVTEITGIHVGSMAAHIGLTGDPNRKSIDADDFHWNSFKLAMYLLRDVAWAPICLGPEITLGICDMFSLKATIFNRRGR